MKRRVDRDHEFAARNDLTQGGGARVKRRAKQRVNRLERREAKPLCESMDEYYGCPVHFDNVRVGPRQCFCGLDMTPRPTAWRR